MCQLKKKALQKKTEGSDKREIRFIKGGQWFIKSTPAVFPFEIKMHLDMLF